MFGSFGCPVEVDGLTLSMPKVGSADEGGGGGGGRWAWLCVVLPPSSASPSANRSKLHSFLLLKSLICNTSLLPRSRTQFSLLQLELEGGQVIIKKVSLRYFRAAKSAQLDLGLLTLGLFDSP